MIKLLVVSLLCAFFSITKVNAIPKPPSPPAHGNPWGTPPGLAKKAPIDSGVLVLFFVGVLYGVSYLKKRPLGS